MIQNFTEIHEQLKQLAPTINSFKSEAVQLRIVELIFSGGSTAPEVENHPELATGASPNPAKKSRKKRRAAPTQTSDSVKTPGGKKNSGRPGPGAIVDTLISEGFFKTGKGPADIVEHCKNDKVLTYNNTEITVALTRAVKALKLKREKNQDGQFRYSIR